MGDAYIVRRGGVSEGLSKCTIIVHAEHGSTVAAYSNSAATTKVKDATEVGASGSYVITGLNTGTYYVKVAKGSQSKISSAITFSAYAVKEVTLNYELTLLSETSGIASGYSTTNTYSASTKKVTLANGYKNFTPAIDVSSYTSLKIKANTTWTAAVGAGFDVGISNKSNPTSQSDFIAKASFTSADGGAVTKTISLSGVTGNIYVVTYINTGAANGEIYSINFS